jgi:hypothetical protein
MACFAPATHAIKARDAPHRQDDLVNLSPPLDTGNMDPGASLRDGRDDGQLSRPAATLVPRPLFLFVNRGPHRLRRPLHGSRLFASLRPG